MQNFPVCQNAIHQNHDFAWPLCRVCMCVCVFVCVLPAEPLQRLRTAHTTLTIILSVQIDASNGSCLLSTETTPKTLNSVNVHRIDTLTA